MAGTTPWEGVRNYEARNLMRAMRVGDQVRAHALLHVLSFARSFAHARRLCYVQLLLLQILFYHSNCKAPGESSLVLAWWSDRRERVRVVMATPSAQASQGSQRCVAPRSFSSFARRVFMSMFRVSCLACMQVAREAYPDRESPVARWGWCSGR